MPRMDAAKLRELEGEALVTVRALAGIGLGYFGGAIREERKADKSLVSEADRAIEARCKELLAQITPEFGFLGEESGSVARLDGATPEISLDLAKHTYWMLDPIDGTINFLSRVPLWTTLLALVHRGEPVLGIVSLPCLDEVFIASHGNGARYGKLQSGSPEKPCAVRPYRELAQAHLSTTSPTGFCFRGAEGWYSALLARPAELRTHSDAYGFTRVLCGGIDAMVDPIVAHYDVAALQVLFDETPGACFTTLHGDKGPFRYRCGSALAATSSALAVELLDSYRKHLHLERTTAQLPPPQKRAAFVSDFRISPDVIPFTAAAQPVSQHWIRALEHGLADWRVMHPDARCAPFVNLEFTCQTLHSMVMQGGNAISTSLPGVERCALESEVTGAHEQQSYFANVTQRSHPDAFLHDALARAEDPDAGGAHTLAETQLLRAVSGAFPAPNAWPYGTIIATNGLAAAAALCAKRQKNSASTQAWRTTLSLEILDTFALTRIAGQSVGTKVRLHCEVLPERTDEGGLRVTRSIAPGTLTAAWAELVDTHAQLMDQLEGMDSVETV